MLDQKREGFQVKFTGFFSAISAEEKEEDEKAKRVSW